MDEQNRCKTLVGVHLAMHDQAQCTPIKVLHACSVILIDTETKFTRSDVTCMHDTISCHESP